MKFESPFSLFVPIKEKASQIDRWLAEISRPYLAGVELAG